MDDLSGALETIKQRLLRCSPFCGLPKDKIRDVRKNAPKPREKDCPERPILLYNLAGTLVRWQSAQNGGPYVDFLNTDLDQHVALLEHDLSVWSQLPPIGIHFDGQVTRHRAILKMTRDLSHALRQSRLVYRAKAGQALPAVPFSAGPPVYDASALIIQTVQLMATDFRAFGHHTELTPNTELNLWQTILKEEFPRDAIYHALAAILNGLGIRNTHGKRFTAAGIQQLLRRHPPPSYMYPRDDRILGLDN